MRTELKKRVGGRVSGAHGVNLQYATEIHSGSHRIFTALKSRNENEVWNQVQVLKVGCPSCRNGRRGRIQDASHHPVHLYYATPAGPEKFWNSTAELLARVDDSYRHGQGRQRKAEVMFDVPEKTRCVLTLANKEDTALLIKHLQKKPVAPNEIQRDALRTSRTSIPDLIRGFLPPQPDDPPQLEPCW